MPALALVAFLPLCLFVGAALSATALPMLACILKELGLLGMSLGETAMVASGGHLRGAHAVGVPQLVRAESGERGGKGTRGRSSHRACEQSTAHDGAGGGQRAGALGIQAARQAHHELA